MLPLALPVVPAVEAVPAVLPVAELPVVEPAAEDELLPMLAFVKMNDAPEPDPDGVRDAVEPDAVEPAADPVVPVAPLASPRCRQPTTVIVPLCDDLAEDCGVCGVPSCAATSAAQAKPIAKVTPTRFIYASLACYRRRMRCKVVATPTNLPLTSAWRLERNPFVRPIGDRFNWRRERATLPGECVLDAHRRVRQNRTRYDPFALELAQPVGQHPVGDLGNAGAEGRETAGLLKHDEEDRTGPATADELARPMKADAQLGPLTI